MGRIASERRVLARDKGPCNIGHGKGGRWVAVLSGPTSLFCLLTHCPARPCLAAPAWPFARPQEAANKVRGCRPTALPTFPHLLARGASVDDHLGVSRELFEVVEERLLAATTWAVGWMRGG